MNTATNLIDIKPPIELPSWAWLWWTLAAVLCGLAALALGAWLFWRWRKARALAVPPVMPAHVRARQSLEDALALIAQPKPFCTSVSGTVRWYLEERFSFRAPERTTEEFLHELRGTDLLLPDQKESLGEFLRQCDLVKFARYEPREQELRGLHDSALRLVEETEPQPSNPEPGTRNPEHVSP